jgi:hypothetical protein
LVEYDDDEKGVILRLRLDEGEGMVAGDEANAIEFSIESPTWVPGNTR